MISLSADTVLNTMVKQHRKAMSRDCCGLSFIHLVQLMGFNGTSVQQLGINHIARPHISN